MLTPDFIDFIFRRTFASAEKVLRVKTFRATSVFPQCTRGKFRITPIRRVAFVRPPNIALLRIRGEIDGDKNHSIANQFVEISNVRDYLSAMFRIRRTDGRSLSARITQPFDKVPSRFFRACAPSSLSGRKGTCPLLALLTCAYTYRSCWTRDISYRAGLR